MKLLSQLQMTEVAENYLMGELNYILEDVQMMELVSYLHELNKEICIEDIEEVLEWMELLLY